MLDSSVITAVAQLISICVKLAESVEKVSENRRNRQEVVSRIKNSLEKLYAVCSDSRNTSSSVGLLKDIEALQRELEDALVRLQRITGERTGSRTQFKQWWKRNSIDVVLRGIQDHISKCLIEFEVQSNIRIERTIDTHQAQLLERLDTLNELLRRSTLSDSSISSLSQDLRSLSGSPTSPMSTTFSRETSFSSTSFSPPRTASHGSYWSTSEAKTTANLESYLDEAQHLEEEIGQLEGAKLFSLAVPRAIRLVSLRRSVRECNGAPNDSTVTLAQSLDLLLTCQTRSDGARDHIAQTLEELGEVYGLLFDQSPDDDFLLKYAVKLCKVSVQPLAMAGSPDGGLLTAAKGNIELSIAQLSKLYNDGVGAGYAAELAEAYIRLSYIFSDLGKHDRALSIARRALEVSSCVKEGQSHRRLTHSSLMRMAETNRSLGRTYAAQISEERAFRLVAA